MSIRTIIAAWETDGSLSVVRREVEAASPVRCVMATRYAQSKLSGPWGSIAEEERFRTIKAVLDSFISGDVMAVRVPPSKSARAQIALLEPPEAAVWAFRTRPDKVRNNLRYGVRVFGMFAERDLFIAMSAEFKENLLDESEYSEEIAFCRRRWGAFFSSYDPVLGSNHDAYVSNYILS